MNFCFVSGTLVHTPDGLRNIEEFQPGDCVYAWDMVNHRLVEAQVEKLVNSTHVGDLVVVRLAGIEESVRCTPSHPFRVLEGGALSCRALSNYQGYDLDSGDADIGGSWVRAADLREGDLLLDPGGSIRVIDSIGNEKRKSCFGVHNLHVRTFSNYFAGATGLLVHNHK
ncbi:MAG: hypothetical protein P1V35_17970 [Planctomycetota bacterium]|nr:hypothetical protein [Planctomycetota bacterium]